MSAQKGTAPARWAHLDEGTLWALADGALDLASGVEAEAHLAGCAACSTLADEIDARRSRLAADLSALEISPKVASAGVATRALGAAHVAAARAQLDLRLAAGGHVTGRSKATDLEADISVLHNEFRPAER